MTLPRYSANSINTQALPDEFVFGIQAHDRLLQVRSVSFVNSELFGTIIESTNSVNHRFAVVTASAV